MIPLYYGLIDENGIRRLDVENKLELPDLQRLVGCPAETAVIQFVSCQFSDLTIDLICDMEAETKNLPVTCVTPQYIRLRGDVIVAGATADGHTIAISLNQLALVERQLVIPCKQQSPTE